MVGLDTKGTVVWIGSKSWMDYFVVVDIKFGDNDDVGVLVCFQDDDNYIRVVVSRQCGMLWLVYRVDGMDIMLDEVVVTYFIGKWFNMWVMVLGSCFLVAIDGEILIEVVDFVFLYGVVGVVIGFNDDVFFDHFVVDLLLGCDGQGCVFGEWMDGFFNGDVDNWIVLQGSWDVKDGVLVEISKEFINKIYVGVDHSDVVVLVWMMNEDIGWIGLIVCLLDISNYYWCYVWFDSNYI